MHRAIPISVVLITAAGLLIYGENSSQAELAGIAERLRNRIEAGEALEEIVACGDLVYCSSAVPEFYERRGFRPAWVDESGPQPLTDSLLKAIAGAHDEGLNPAHYHLAVIRDLLQELRPSREHHDCDLVGMLVDLELLLSDAFLVYGSHLLAGRVDPQRIDPEWHAQRRDMDLAAVLEQAVGSARTADTLEELLPPQPGYRRLKEALRLYRDIARDGGWPAIETEKKLKRGYRGPEVVALRSRLIASGDLAADSVGAGAGPRGMVPMPADSSATAAESSGASDVFDEVLERAVAGFQRRNGLDADGVVGPATRAALNMPVEDRIDQIEINMERYRWLPHDLGSRHILVNIANFELKIIEGEKPVASMRVVVGREYRRTPVFSDIVTYLVMNPYWNVPNTIAIQDIVPSARKDSTYLADKKFRVYESWGADAKEIDPKSIDWSNTEGGDFDYRFTQAPGPENSLGQIKFMFPNEFHVYLHDTPAKGLFDRTERTLSSGCIRVERPIDLAEYLLRQSPEWTRESIIATLETWEEQTVPLPEPIPIHLLYWTTYVDADGAIHFRKDVYDRDQRLLSALRKLPPGPGEAHNHPQMN